MSQIQKKALWFRGWLNQPERVFVVCAFVLVISLFLNGTVWKIWGLHRDRATITQQIHQAEMSVLNFDKLMLRAKDPSYIERQALDKMDLISENDIIFVFPE